MRLNQYIEKYITICHNWINNTIITSLRRKARLVEKKQDKSTCNRKWYILVWGLELANDIHYLGHGLTLRKLESPISVFDLAAAGAVGFHEWAVLEPMVSGCFCEIESLGDYAKTPGYDTLNRAWLVSTMLKLLGFGKHLCLACSSYSWNIIAGYQKRTKHIFFDQMIDEGVEAAVYNSKRKLPDFEGGLLDYHIKFFVEKDKRNDAFNKEDELWIKQNFEILNNLAANSNKFRFALEAATDWRHSKDLRAAIARIWSGIEAIFGIKSELVYRISLLASSVLIERGQHRKNKFDEIKRLYGIRSKAVHGEALPEEVLIKGMNDSYELLRDLLFWIIAKGCPPTQKDFDKAVFW